MSATQLRLRLLVAVLVVTGCRGVAAQRSNPAAIQARLRAGTVLAAEEVADLLQATREAVAYKTLTLAVSPTDGAGVDVLMGSDGQPVFTRSRGGFTFRNLIPVQESHLDAVTITHYTRQAAQHCDDGAFGTGELVVEYVRSGPGWTTAARELKAGDALPMFPALAGEVPLEDAGTGTVGNRQVRGLRAPWNPRGQTPGATQTLWIDERSLLPLRWSVVVPQTASPTDAGMLFLYDSSIDVRAPEGIRAPDCVAR
jgi:hypothetical protein